MLEDCERDNGVIVLYRAWTVVRIPKHVLVEDTEDMDMDIPTVPGQWSDFQNMSWLKTQRICIWIFLPSLGSGQTFKICPG